MKFKYCGSVKSDLNLIKSFIDSILIDLTKVITDDDALFDIRLILNELIINGVFHGNECVENKCVNIDLQVIDNKVTIKVTDEGAGIDYNLDSYDPISLKCSGRGLVLVNGLSDEVIVENNCIVAIKCI